MAQRQKEGSARDRLLDGLHVHERRLDVAGVATSVLQAGQGPPLLLLHGGNGWVVVPVIGLAVVLSLAAHAAAVSQNKRENPPIALTLDLAGLSGGAGRRP